MKKTTKKRRNKQMYERGNVQTNKRTKERMKLTDQRTDTGEIIGSIQ